MTPHDDLAGARDATRRLLDHLADLQPAGLLEPSLLPGWTRAHVVAHLAGNARSHVRMLDGCLAGEVRSQYADAAAREAGIVALGAEPTGALAAARDACAELEQRWSALTPELWASPVRWLDRGTAPAATTVWSRWKEVEVHRVDLQAGYAPADWPGGFADRLLAALLRRTDLPEMVLVADGRSSGASGVRISGSSAELAGWLSGRSDGRTLQTSGRLPEIPAWA